MNLYESVIASVGMGLVVLDPEQRIALWNGWMEHYSGLRQSEVLGRSLQEVFPGLDNKRLEHALAQALRGFPSVLSQTLHKSPFPLQAQPGGPRVQQAVSITPVDVDGAARHCLIQVSDVSMAVNRERLLRDQTMILRTQTFSDGLTGIANRRHFDTAIDKEVRRAKRAGTPLSLLMIDIDCFKAYNDHYGHQQGDDTLIKVASALNGLLHRPFDLIARYGGEEFAVILPDLDQDQGLALAESMRAHIAQMDIPHAQSTVGSQVTVSVGLATRAGDTLTEAAELIGAADRALYQAKRAGRNRVHT